jgi:Domain of unknown function (DUF4270)
MDSFFTMRRLLVCGSVIALIFSGCTRITTTDVGSGLIPPIDGITTLDTTYSVITDSYDDLDTIRVYKSDTHVLGAITNDPLFGKSTGAIYFEVAANGYPYFMTGTKDSIKVDSAVLVLSYRGAYGDSTQPVKLNVYEINSLMEQFRDYPVNYPSLFPISYNPSALAPTQTIDIRRLGDSVINRFEASKNQIRIKLNNSFAKRMILDYDSTNAYKSDSILRTYFNGFAVIPDPSSPSNALLNINLADTNTKLALYYTTATSASTVRDTVVSYLRFNAQTSGHANYISRNRTGSEVVGHLSPTPKIDSLLYVQSMPGTGVRIRVPGLQNLSNRIIHRAELITEQVPDDAHPGVDNQMLPPRYLMLSIYDSVYQHKRNIPNDFVVTSLAGPNISEMGGYITYKSTQGYDQVAAYNFNISRYVQGIASRSDTAFNLILTAPSNDSLYYSAAYPNQSTRNIWMMTPTYGNIVSNGRVRLGGGNNTRFRMRLRIVYSKLK